MNFSILPSRYVRVVKSMQINQKTEFKFWNYKHLNHPNQSKTRFCNAALKLPDIVLKYFNSSGVEQFFAQPGHFLVKANMVQLMASWTCATSEEEANLSQAYSIKRWAENQLEKRNFRMQWNRKDIKKRTKQFWKRKTG